MRPSCAPPKLASLKPRHQLFTGRGCEGTRSRTLGNLCTTRCVALGVGARGAYTRGHSETRYGDVCLREPAPRLRVRLRGALACKAPSAPTPSATITCADVPFELMQERALLCARPFVS